MPEPLVAKHRRGDGTPVVRVETPRYFNEDEAARALATVYAGKPPLVGVPAVQSGLNLAAQHGMDLAGADPALTEQYRKVLRKPAVRAKFFRHLRDDEGRMRSFTWLKRPQEEATHVRTDVATFLDEDQAARALAMLYPETPKRVGRMTCAKGLGEAVRERLLETGKLTGDWKERVEFWRQTMRSTEPPMF